MFIDSRTVIDEVRRGFDGRRVVVVGDVMLDRYLWGNVERISPEAPVPVVRLERETETAGGAANVAKNLAALGLKVKLVSITGDDPARNLLLQNLRANDIDAGSVLASSNRITTVKTRVVGNHQQMIRVDAEHTQPLAEQDAERLVAEVSPLLSGTDALVLSDYAKGVLTDQVCRGTIRAARELGVPVLVDPKGQDFTRYAGATLITPNRKELGLVSGIASTDLDGLLAAAKAMRQAIDLQWVVLTLSEQGMALIGADGSHRLPAVAREVFDVSGAGDTVIATFAAGLSAHLAPVDVGHLANLASGVVVGKVGTVTITADELLAAVRGESALEQAAKICNADQALELTRQWRAAGERFVFTNGCFDLLHVGHATYLERARGYGHRLVVGLNTDRSVRALKGAGRPLIGENDRARVLAAFASVDAVVLFDQDTPLELVKLLRPDVLAKGADYREEEVVGASEVKSWGGQVVLVPLTENHSTSGIIERMGRPSNR